jgi:hypothetical protein
MCHLSAIEKNLLAVPRRSSIYPIFPLLPPEITSSSEKQEKKKVIRLSKQLLYLNLHLIALKILGDADKSNLG